MVDDIEFTVEPELEHFDGCPVLAIGVFDGVHLGHQYLLRRLVERAKQLGTTATAMTFDPHPRAILGAPEPVRYLVGLAERKELIRSLGVEVVITLHFTRDVANKTAEEFLSTVKARFGISELWVAQGFALGRGRHATGPILKEIAAGLGITVHTIAPLTRDGVVVSSTNVRRLVQEGDVKAAAELLGRPYSLEGTVERGAQRGRLLGFPTANIACDPSRVLPMDGVYVVRALLPSGSYPAVADIGTRPSFGENERALEVHILDFDQDIYGQPMRVEFLTCLRPDTRFASVEELKAQVSADIQVAAQYHAALAKEKTERHTP